MSEDKSPTRHSRAAARGDGGIQTSVIYCGDCLDELKRLPDNCIDLVYIDPLFHSGRSYEIRKTDGERPRAGFGSEPKHDIIRPRCVTAYT